MVVLLNTIWFRNNYWWCHRPLVTDCRDAFVHNTPPRNALVCIFLDWPFKLFDMQSDFAQVYALLFYSPNKLELITASNFLSKLYPSFDIHNQNRCNGYKSLLLQIQTKFELICYMFSLKSSKCAFKYPICIIFIHWNQLIDNFTSYIWFYFWMWFDFSNRYHSIHLWKIFPFWIVPAIIHSLSRKIINILAFSFKVCRKPDIPFKG